MEYTTLQNHYQQQEQNVVLKNITVEKKHLKKHSDTLFLQLRNSPLYTELLFFL